MRVFSQALLTAFISFAVYINGNSQSTQDFNKVIMRNWSLGRVDFILPQQYRLSGRIQNIYYVDVTTTSLEGKKAEDVLKNKIKKIKAVHIKAGNKEETIKIKEIENGFHVIFYQANSSSPELVKLEAQKIVENNLLEMSFEGKAGKENDMLRGLSIIANSYYAGASHGFNIGAGSITSTPGLNEYAHAGFKEQDNGIDLKVSSHVATPHLNHHPLQDIEDEINGLASDGITLKVLKNEERTVAGFKGNEGHISLVSQNEEPEFRFTWFTPGVTADSFKPEILIKVHGPLKNIESFKATWEDLLKSLKIRSAN